MAGNIRQRLSKLEAQAPARAYNCDVFADIERFTALFEFFQVNGRWPAEMSRDERRQLEANLRLIGGNDSDEHPAEAGEA